jgi:hypothetical protein
MACRRRRACLCLPTTSSLRTLLLVAPWFSPRHDVSVPRVEHLATTRPRAIRV